MSGREVCGDTDEKAYVTLASDMEADGKFFCCAHCANHCAEGEMRMA